MNLYVHPDAKRRAPLRAALALGAVLGLATAGPGPARAEAAPPAAPAPTCRTPTFAGWQLFVGNRSRMIQVATVCMLIGIFILTRGRWK
jgi:hypothetical protein